MSCNASIGVFASTLEQEHIDDSVRPIAYVSRGTLDSERHWTRLDWEAGSIVSSAFEAALGVRSFAFSRITRAFVRACNLLSPSTSVPGIGLGWLVLQPDSAFFGGLPLTSTVFCDFRAHGPRMRINDVSAPTGKFVARVVGFVGTGDDRLGHAPLWPATDATSTSVFVVPVGPLCENYPVGPLRPRRRLQGHCCLRAASPLGGAEEQPLLPVPRSIPLMMVSDPAGLPCHVVLGSTLRRAFRALDCL